MLTTAVSVFQQSVGAPGLWSDGKTGRGVAIAVLDSGIQAHLDFGWPTRIVAARRFNDRASTTADQLGHGTWVAGIAAGAGNASYGRYMGIAPGASIVNLKVSDDNGAAYASDVVEALGWIATNHAAHNIRVANLSFVSSLDEGYATSVLDAAVEMVWHAGVVVVVSSGNRGADTLRFAPANDPYVITVGANDDMATRVAHRRHTRMVFQFRLDARSSLQTGPGGAWPPHRRNIGQHRRGPGAKVPVEGHCATLHSTQRYVRSGPGCRRRRGAAPAGASRADA